MIFTMFVSNRYTFDCPLLHLAYLTSSPRSPITRDSASEHDGGETRREEMEGYMGRRRRKREKEG